MHQRTISQLSRSHRIYIRIERAEGLRAADSNGKSDPYVTYGRVAAAKGEVYKTKVIEKTLDPVWNESTTLYFDPQELTWSMAFDIYDKDAIGKDFLGHAEIDLKKELLTDKKLDRDVVLELGPAPKTSEKTAKKVTGKLHLHITCTPLVTLDDETRTKLETQTEFTFEELCFLIHAFHEVSGGANTIAEKEKMALLANNEKIFKFMVTLSVNDDVTDARTVKDSFEYTDAVIREIVSEPALVDYWSRVMLVITGSQKDGVITLANYVEGCDLVFHFRNFSFTEYQSTQKRDTMIFDLIDMDGDGAVTYNDLMAFQAFVPYAVQRKMEAQFLKDPKVAKLKETIGKDQYIRVMKEMFDKFNFSVTLRGLVISLIVRATAETYNLNDVKYTREQYMTFFADEKRRKNIRVCNANELCNMIKDHSRDAQMVLHLALKKNGCN